MNKLPCRVRPARPGDLDEVAHLWRASALAMSGRSEELEPVPTAAALRERIGTELELGWELLVAEQGDRLVGMLALRPGCGQLNQLFVLPEDWGRGVGGQLVAEARRRMPGGFRLRMASGNGRASAFYASHGLRRVGTGSHPVTGVPVTFLAWP